MKVLRKRSDMELYLDETLFYVFWFIMLTLKALGFQEGMLIYNAGLLVSFGCIVLKLVLEKHPLYEWMGIGLLLILGGLIYLSSHEKAPLIYIMLVLGMKHVPVRRVFASGLVIWSVCFLYRIAAAITGLNIGTVFVHEKMGLGPILRWDFGYAHPNVLQISYAVLLAFILYMYSEKGKKQLKLLVLLFLGNCYIFLYSVSYTGVILNTICLIAFYYFVNRKEFSRIEKAAIQCILPLCVIFSIAGPLLTEKGMPLESLDPLFFKLLNARFLCSRQYLYRGLTLFGRTQEQLDITFALDSSYVTLLIRDGVVFFALVLIGYGVLINRYLKWNRRKELAVIISFLIAGISEPFLFNVSFKNLIFVFLGECCYSLCAKISVANRWTRPIGLDWGKKSLWILRGIPCGGRQKVRKLVQGKKKNIVIAAFICAVVCGIGYRGLINVPESIYVDKGYTDVAEQQEVYLDLNQLPENFNSLIYDYQGPEAPLYEFSGNMVKLEIVRGIISWSLIGILAGGCCMALICLERRTLEKKRGVKRKNGVI